MARRSPVKVVGTRLFEALAVMQRAPIIVL
jgi:hypothetical protein